MTREEANKLVIDNFSYSGNTERLVSMLVNQIFDDFENRSCGSCKYLTATGCCSLLEIDIMSCANQPCKGWEQK